MSRAVEETNRRMLRARDAMDRDYAQPLDIPTLARIACVSDAHFIRVFRATFGETPHRYLQRRRALGMAGIIAVDDIHRTYEELVAKGVEFTEEPTERFYGTDCGLRDPFGNPLRIGTPKGGPIEIPRAGQVASGDWS